MDQSTIAQPVEDELRLSDIIVDLWDGRWIIAAGCALGLVAGFALNLVLPDAYEAELVMVPAVAATDQSYAALNTRLDFVPLDQMVAGQVTRSGTGDVQAVEVTQTFLIESLIQELRSVPVVASSLDQAGLLSRDDFDDEQQFLSEAARFADKIDFLPPAEDIDSSSFQRRFWQMSYAGNGTPSDARAYAAAVIDRATANVQEGTLNIVGEAIDLRAQDEAFALDDLDVRRDIVIEEYQSGLASRIALLEENASIARRLGIENGEVGDSSRFEAETIAGGSESLFSITQEAPAYLRGYAALEEEISLLKQRSDPELFVDALPEIARRARMIESDQQVERVRAALQASPLASEDFRIIEFDPGLVRVDRHYPLPIVLSVGLALGALTGMALVGFRNTLRNRRV